MINNLISCFMIYFTVIAVINKKFIVINLIYTYFYCYSSKICYSNPGLAITFVPIARRVA